MGDHPPLSELESRQTEVYGTRFTESTWQWVYNVDQMYCCSPNKVGKNEVELPLFLFDFTDKKRTFFWLNVNYYVSYFHNNFWCKTIVFTLEPKKNSEI